MSTTSKTGPRTPSGRVRAPLAQRWRRTAPRPEFLTRYQILAALAVYLITALVLTWPLVLHLGSSIYLSPARPYGDYTGTIANLQALLEGPHNPFLPGRTHAFNAPEGLPINWVLNLATFPEMALLFILGASVGAIAALDLLVLFAFVASGLAMFGLVRGLTHRFGVALLMGWAFAFYPFAVANGEHPDYINGWPLVLMLWAGLRAVERPTLRRGALAGAAAVLGMSWTPYYLLLGGVAFASEVVAALAIGWREKRLKAQATAFAIACAVVAGYVALLELLSRIAPGATGEGINSLGDVVAQSSRPLNYVLAPSWNPVLGPVTGHSLMVRGWEVTEKTLYVGLSLVLLALLGVFAALRRRLTPNQARAVVVAGVVGIVAALCSGPPQVAIGRHLVNMPSWYLFHLTSAFRIYSRFVIVVELALCVLAGVGLVSLLPRRRPAVARLVLAVAAVVVVLDLWAPIPDHFARLSVPRIYAVLAKQPPGIYAEYPLGPANQRPDYHDLFLQAYAHHPLLNGYKAGSLEAERDEGLGDLTVASVGGRLRALGVRYILLERDPIPPFTPAARPRPGFVRLAEDSYGTLYRNDSPPAPIVKPLDGFALAEGSPGAQRRWIAAPAARLKIVAKCGRCVGELSFESSSLAYSRVLTVSDDATGRVLARTSVLANKQIRLPLAFAHQIVLRFSTSPGPEAIRAVYPGSLDPSSVSVLVLSPQFRLTEPGPEAVGSW